jgi:hypothetical protein
MRISNSARRGISIVRRILGEMRRMELYEMLEGSDDSYWAMLSVGVVPALCSAQVADFSL